MKRVIKMAMEVVDNASELFTRASIVNVSGVGVCLTMLLPLDSDQQHQVQTGRQLFSKRHLDAVLVAVLVRRGAATPPNRVESIYYHPCPRAGRVQPPLRRLR